MSVLTCSALGEARACTFIPSRFTPGSKEDVAEQHAFKRSRAEAITQYDLVFVGRVVAQRAPDLAEITAGLDGRFTTGSIVIDFATGSTRPDTFVPGWRSWFETVEILKGKPDQPTTNILSGVYSSSCGPGPKLTRGEEVLVFADLESGYWVGDTATIDLLPLLRPLLK